MFGFSSFAGTSFGVLPSRIGFTFAGEAQMELVGTTAFINLIESGRGLLSYAAEIHLRSL